jgi:hypothetical protein
MKRRTLRWNVIPDEGGQALTEFVIVIPIILLFFFAMVQYFSIVQSTQLGNYAAFEAARVYAVQASVNSTNADSDALIAASICMSPVARPVPGEIGGTYLSDVQNLGNDVVQFLNGIIPGAGYIVEGYPMARYVRYNSDLLGGSVSCSITNFDSTSPTQVVVNINYPQPLYIPGLAELWKFVGDKTNIYSGTQSLASGLTGLPKYLLPIYAGSVPGQDYINDISQYDSSLGNSLSSDETSLLNDLPVVLLPYVNVQSECAIGYCNWSGIVRNPDTIADSQGSGTNNALQQLQQTQQDQNAYSNAMVTLEQDCQNLTNSYQQYLTAKQNYDQSTNSDNLQALENAETAYAGYFGSYGTDGTTLTNDMNTVNNDLKNEPSINGSIPGGVNEGSNGNAGSFNGANTGSQTAPSEGGLSCPCTCPAPPLSTN